MRAVDGGGLSGATVPVWDKAVRAFHWALVIAVAVALATGLFGPRDWLAVHLSAGCAVAALVLFRVVWGVLGPGYARFASFAAGPRTVMSYARGIRSGGVRRYLGHNPLGGVMVLALLAVLTLSVLTGVTLLGGWFKQGPLAPVVSFAASVTVRTVHQALGWLLLAMIAAHVGGVAFESWREDENLAKAMLTGRKRGPCADAAPARGRPWLAGALFGGMVIAVVLGVRALDARPVPGVPPAVEDADYAMQCGACHFPFPPALLPAAAGSAIMDHLSSHFGADASLSAELVGKIRGYLLENSAEHWDTLASVELRGSIDSAQPLRMTATRFWRRMHSGIGDSVFASPAVNGRVSCGACHGDAASGMFAPQSISVPVGAR